VIGTAAATAIKTQHDDKVMLPFFFMSRRGGEQCRKCSDNPGIKPLCTCRTDK